jgi:hypothetical protein
MSDSDPRVEEEGETVRECRADDEAGGEEEAGGGDGAGRGLQDSSSRDGGGATPRPAVGLRAEPFCRVIHPARNYGVSIVISRAKKAAACGVVELGFRV